MHFFFNVRSDFQNDVDKEGIELPDLAAAREEATRSAREMVAEIVRNDERIDGMRYEIADAEGQILDTVWFRDVIKLD